MFFPLIKAFELFHIAYRINVKPLTHYGHFFKVVLPAFTSPVVLLTASCNFQNIDNSSPCFFFEMGGRSFPPHCHTYHEHHHMAAGGQFSIEAFHFCMSDQGGPGCLCLGLSFLGHLYSWEPWKREIMSPSGEKGIYLLFIVRDVGALNSGSVSCNIVLYVLRCQPVLFRSPRRTEAQGSTGKHADTLAISTVSSNLSFASDSGISYFLLSSMQLWQDICLPEG